MEPDRIHSVPSDNAAGGRFFTCDTRTKLEHVGPGGYIVGITAATDGVIKSASV